MKKQLLLAILALPALLLLFASCEKKDNTPKSKTELLVQGSWKFKSATAGGTDFSSTLQDCQKDNIITFGTSGSGNVNEGVLKCNGSDPDDRAFTWAFVNAETQINVSAPFFTNGETILTLKSLTETELVVEMYYNPPVGPSRLVTLTFTH